MKKLTLAIIVGTRPEIIRLSETIKLADKVFNNILVHTGQNYDYQLNEIFFSELGLRAPDFYLNVVGANLGETMGNVITKSYEILSEIKPDAILVLGDTNSVLSTISAKRLKIPIFHMEAGNRCFDLNVPEEINRKISDHVSDVNLTYTENSRRYLISEGFRKDHIFVTGSPLNEVLCSNKKSIDSSNILETLQLEKKKYFVVSLHREENLDLNENFINLMQTLNSVADIYKLPMIFSVHPRTKKRIENLTFQFNPLIKFIEAFGFFDYVHLQINSFCVLSDSGTISEESAILRFPAISVRNSTERPEAIETGSIILGGIDKDVILNAIEVCLATFDFDNNLPLGYDVTNVSKRTVRIIQGYTSVINKEIWKKI
jgi:UDP-N-acetylglucosamine 2-epimerase